jgi:hypothetical protein
MTSPADTIREALNKHSEWDALAALTELEQQLADATNSASWLRENWNRDLAHMRAAEADRDRLSEILSEAVAQHTRWDNVFPSTIDRARAALATPDTPPDA